MRKLDLYQAEVVDSSITEPRYLIEITLEEKRNLSTGESISIGGVFWQTSEVDLKSVGPHSASLSIFNSGYQYTAAAMRGSFQNNPVKIYFAYPYPGVFEPFFPDGFFPDGWFVYPATVAKILLFSGHISEIPSVDEWMSIQCTRNAPKKYPTEKARPPTANYLPAAGQVVSWNSGTFRIPD